MPDVEPRTLEKGNGSRSTGAYEAVFMAVPLSSRDNAQVEKRGILRVGVLSDRPSTTASHDTYGAKLATLKFDQLPDKGQVKNNQLILTRRNRPKSHRML